MPSTVVFNFAHALAKPQANTLYAAYLDHYKRKLENSLSAELAEREFTSFSESLDNLIDQYAFVFQNAVEHRRAILVLGKVQSGKTAHLLGNLAWAAGERSVAFATVFTGTSLALNAQGVERIEKDLVSLDADAVKVLMVPTSPKSPKFEAFFSELRTLVRQRLSGNSRIPMPVLVTIKKPGRIQTILEAKRRLLSDLGDAVAMLLIDDETDQASQNAMARSGRSAATYLAMSKLYEAGHGVMLSYTATPQAVLLTEKYGRLRPDYCQVIEPKFGYFGLEDVVSPRFSRNLTVVDDLLPKITSHNQPPKSLVTAIAAFFLVALIRRIYPNFFYSGANAEALSEHRMMSVQMLVHQSAAKIEHAHLKHLVEVAIEDLKSSLNLGSSGSSVASVFETEWLKTRKALGKLQELPEFISQEMEGELLELLSSVAIRVVNSDANRKAPEESLPVRNSEWESNKTWILIGGEILGRGITIPQLCVSYFVRSATRPKFDTVSQQMRFCGYRQDYAGVTRIFSTRSNLDLFAYMNGIDGVLWRKARRWSSGRTRISGSLQPVYYASPADTPLDPCRKSVQDPNLQDLKFGKGTELIVSLHDIFNPLHVKENIALLNDLFPNNTFSTSDRSKYHTLEHVPETTITKLLVSWEASLNTRTHLKAIAALFDESLEDWGLANIPITAHLKLPRFSDFQLNSVFEALAPIKRGTSNFGSDASKWLEVRDLDYMPEPIDWPTLRVPHVGAGQRALRNRFAYDSTVLIVEPIQGVAPNSEHATAWGLGLTIFRPDGFELRILGHR